MPIRPSRLIADLLRRRREQMGLTLRDVEERTAGMGEVIPFNTVAAVEKGRVDPGLRRLDTLLRLYGVEPQHAADLLDLERMAGSPPAPGGSLEELCEQGRIAWDRGDVRTALACFVAMRERAPGSRTERLVRQKALIAFATVASNMGRNALARNIVEGLLLEPPEAEVLPNVLLYAAVVWNRAGSREAAFAFVSRAEALARQDDVRARAWIAHEKGVLHRQAGQLREAAACLARARRLYCRAGDRHGEGLVLAVGVDLALDEGDPRRALRRARLACRHAERYGFKRLFLCRLLDEAAALRALGRPREALAPLRRALEAGARVKDTPVCFDAHFGLWKTFLHLEDDRRAAGHLGAAQTLVSLLDGRSPEADEVRATLGSP